MEYISTLGFDRNYDLFFQEGGEVFKIKISFFDTEKQ